MDNESETRPLLHSFQSETWRSRARKRCMRIPSEITITGIILGLFLIVVTLLIVLENMESDKKEKNISLDDNLLASPMKFNKKADDLTWQNKDYMTFKDKQMEEKSKKWDKVNKGYKQLPDISASPTKFINKVEGSLWPDKRDYYMKLKVKKIEEKWDKVNKGWKKLPDISASPTNFNKKVEDSLWQDKREYFMKLKAKKIEEKWDKVNKGWKKLPDISGNIHDHDYDERQKDLNDDGEITAIADDLYEYGKEIDESLERFVNMPLTPGISEPSAMTKFREQALHAKSLLHSGINWKLIDDGWKALSEQGWREKDIRRALFMAMREKGQEIRKAELQNILQSPMNIEDIWDQLNDSWKKNLYEGNEDVRAQKIKGTDESKRHLSINDEWRKKMDTMQSPKSDMKKAVKDDEGWQKLAEQGKNNEKSQIKTNDEWANKFSNILQSSYQKWKDNDEKKDKHSKYVPKNEDDDKSDDEPRELKMNFDDFSSIIEAIKEHQKGIGNQKPQMEMNDEIANTFVDILQSSYKKWKKYDELKKKHSKDDMKDETSDETEDENDQPQQSPMNFDDFMEIINAIKDHQKGKKEAEKQKDTNDDWKNEMGTLYSSKPTNKRWKQIDEHFKTLIEYERNSLFGRKDGEVTSSPEDISLEKSMPFDHGKQDKMGKEWQKLPKQGLEDKDIKEAIHKAWKDGEKLRNSAFGQNNMKWKKVNDGWKTISNKS